MPRNYGKYWWQVNLPVLSLMHNRRIAIYGGSFDPPHIGHEALARLAVERFGLDQLLVIPAMQPVHRALSGCVDADTKLEWLRAIWRDEPRICVVDWEVAAPTPTIETLLRFAEVYPSVVPLLLLGSDAASGIDNWIDYPKHCGLCNLAVFRRAGESLVLPDRWKPISVSQWVAVGDRIYGCGVLVDCSLPEVSASRVRQRLKEGGDAHDFIPDMIVDGVCRQYDKMRGERTL